MQYKHISIEERERIQQGLWQHKSLRTIAQELGRQPSSISREIERNLPKERFLYTPRLSHERALIKRKSRGRIDSKHQMFSKRGNHLSVASFVLKNKRF